MVEVDQLLDLLVLLVVVGEVQVVMVYLQVQVEQDAVEMVYQLL